MRFLRLASLALGPVAVLGLTSCAAGPGPDLSGPQGPSLMAAYSGDWVLVRTESDDLAAKMRGAGGARPGLPTGGGMAGGRRGGGMTGGRSGGGGMGGGVAGGGMGDPEQARAAMRAMQLLGRVPGDMNVLLRPESVTITETGPEPEAEPTVLLLPLNGEEQEARMGGAAFFAKVKWTDEGLEIEKKVDGGGDVKDKISLDQQGRLIVKREIKNPMGSVVDGTLVYRKAEAGG